MNAIQDRFADLSNFTQTVDLQAVRIGASDLQFVYYGPSEGRVTGALRADGLLRGLGGVLPGAFTTAQRDAITAGMAPAGTIIFNSTLGKLQVNLGTDAARNWQALETQTTVAAPTGRFAGEMTWYAGNPSVSGIVEPIAGWLVCNGAAISRTTYATLFANIGGFYGAGDGSTTFNIPNFVGGRVPVPAGGGFAIGAVGGASTVVIGVNEMPWHGHAIGADGWHGHTFSALFHHNHANSSVRLDMHRSQYEAEGYGLTTSAWFRNQVMVHASTQPNTYVIGDTDDIKNAWWEGGADGSGTHSHGGGVGGAGGGGAHNNMAPYQVAGQILIKY